MEKSMIKGALGPTNQPGLGESACLQKQGGWYLRLASASRYMCTHRHPHKAVHTHRKKGRRGREGRREGEGGRKEGCKSA